MESTSSINSLFTATQKIGAIFSPIIQTNLGKITSWTRDANSRDRDVVIFCRDETLVRLETVSRPRRRDRDHIPATYTTGIGPQPLIQ